MLEVNDAKVCLSTTQAEYVACGDQNKGGTVRV